MTGAVKWSTDANVVQTIAQDSFGGWEHGLLEAIKNSLDATATRIDITVPTREILVEDPEQRVVIEDNGTGMTLSELEDGYCRFGCFKVSHRGTGKVATLKVTRRATLETWRDGTLLRIEFDTAAVLATRGGDFPDLDLKAGVAPIGSSGTRLTLSQFTQDTSPPSVATVHHVLLRNFLHCPSVKFFVNGEGFRAEDHATQVLVIEDEPIEGVGTASIIVLLAKPKERLGKPGIMVCAGGQSIHGPDVFGLDAKGYRGDAESATRRLLGRIDLHPTDGAPIASGAWTLTEQYGLVREWAGRHLESVVDKTTAEVVDDRVEKWLQDPPTRRYFNKLPDDERAVARRILKDQAKNTGSQSQGSQTVINRFVCRSLLTDALSVVMDMLNDSSNEEVEKFSELFKGHDRWTLRQVTRAASLVKHHLQAVRDLNTCIGDYTKNEWQIHEILKENPWLIADDFHSFRSNRQLKTTLKKLFNMDVDDREALRRPDFFFALGDVASSSLAQPGRFLFIELKGPDQPLDMTHQNQVVRDAKTFLRHQPGFAYCVLIGSELDPKEPPDPDTESKGVYTFKSMTYRNVIERATFRLDYISDGVKESGAEELARKVRDSEIEMLVQTTGSPKKAGSKRPPSPRASRAASGVTLPLRRVTGTDVRPFENCVPIYSDLKIAAGQWSDARVIEGVPDEGAIPNPDDFNWVEPPAGVKLDRRLFVAQVVGESMNNPIPDGSWCLWRLHRGGEDRLGRVVLAQHRDIQDEGLGAGFTVKVYEREQKQADGTWTVVLRQDSSDPRFGPITLTGLTDGDRVVLAELVEVLG